jgi:hypothetical protein
MRKSFFICVLIVLSTPSVSHSEQPIDVLQKSINTPRKTSSRKSFAGLPGKPSISKNSPSEFSVQTGATSLQVRGGNS